MMQEGQETRSPPRDHWQFRVVEGGPSTFSSDAATGKSLLLQSVAFLALACLSSSLNLVWGGCLLLTSLLYFHLGLAELE